MNQPRAYLPSSLLAALVLAPSVVWVHAKPTQDLSGNWILNLSVPAQRVHAQLAIIEITSSGDSYAGRVVDAASQLAKAVKLSDITAADESVRLRMSVDSHVWSFDGSLSGDRVQGSVEQQGQLALAWLERTDRRSLEGSQTTFRAAGAREFNRILETEDLKQRARGLLQFVEQFRQSTLVFEAAKTALNLAKPAELSEQEVRHLITAYDGLARAWGRRWTDHVVSSIAHDLAVTDSHPELALAYAQQAQAALSADADEAPKRSVRFALAVALLHAGRADDAKRKFEELIAAEPTEPMPRYYAALAHDKLGDADAAIDSLLTIWPHPQGARELERIWQDKHGSRAGLDERLDRAHLARYPPLPVQPFVRGAEHGNQVVLLELFTGSSCGPCVAAELAVEAILSGFTRSDVMVLEYHTNLAAPDPLTNADAEARARYYNVTENPSLYVNGSAAPPGAGPRRLAGQKHAEYRTLVEKALQQTSDATIDLRSRRDGESLSVRTQLGGVANPGEHLRLRFAIVEHGVRYTGRNGLRLHHAVVRALPGGPEGVPVTEQTLTHHWTIDLAALRRELGNSLAEFAKARGMELPAESSDRTRLDVVAFLQDDATRSVLQAASMTLEPITTSKP
jgi:tetratricopeptide (TPR) repeat protein